MKKYLIKIVLFFAIIVVIDLGVGCLGDYLQAHVKGGGTRALNDFVMKDCYDVLILGSSRAHHHYDTPFLSDTLGLDVYNAGYDGNGVILAYGLLELVLERYQPKLVLFDVEPAFDIKVYKNDNGHKRYISSLKPYYRYSAVGDIIKDVSKEEWYKVHSGLLRYNSVLVSKAMDGYRPFDKGQKGFAPLSGVYSREPENTLDKTVVIDKFKLGYIEKLLVLTKKNNIPMAVVASPKYGVTSSDVMQPVKIICEKYDVKFIDYYAEQDFMIHKEWFKEPMHLNKEGARKFSELLVNDISKLTLQ